MPARRLVRDRAAVDALHAVVRRWAGAPLITSHEVLRVECAKSLPRSLLLVDFCIGSGSCFLGNNHQMMMMIVKITTEFLVASRTKDIALCWRSCLSDSCRR